MNNKHLGSCLEDFPKEEGLLAEVEAAAKRRVAEHQAKLEALNREIAIGLEQANRGEVAEFDFDQFRQELDEELGYIKRKKRCRYWGVKL